MGKNEEKGGIPLPTQTLNAVREDQAYFQEFYRQYRRFLYYCAGQLTADRHLQEDLVQETLLRLLRCIPTLRELNAARTASYLHTAVKNVYIDHCRRTAQSLPLEDGKLEVLGARSDPGDYTAKWDAQILRSRLSGREWFLLEARYISGSSDEEIAETLGCTADSVRSLLSRARRRAKQLLADKDERRSPVGKA